MARATPRVEDETLLLEGAAGLAVGGPEWFAWLERAELFAYSSAVGSFTARKEGRARGGAYWRAYRTVGGRQRRAYLGRSADLSAARLRAAARELAGAPPHLPDPTPLLATKLFAPRPRAALVARPRLAERLDAAVGAALTLVVAPAGFGKTTLLASWLLEAQGARRKAQNERGPQPFTSSWLSLDPADNDPATFLRYLVAALRQGAPGLGEAALAALGQPQPPAIETVLAHLLNDLAALPGSRLLVLDDYHLISAPAVHRAVAFLVEHLPPGLSLAMASRELPPLPLERLRARGQLAELRAEQLRFTPAEAAAFLRDVMGLAVGPAEAAALEARTEGWAAGLQLAALALRDHADRAGFMAGFSGDSRYIGPYLAAEVLDQLPAELGDFLLRTSILERLHPDLCAAVLAGESPAPNSHSTVPGLRSTDLLAELERRNLFLVPLDERGEWRRYHHLFAELLRERLSRALPPDELAELHRRAGSWLGARGYTAEAMAHLLAAGDYPAAAELAGEQATALVDRGEYRTVLAWLEALPRDLLGPGLALAATWAALNAAAVELAFGYLGIAEAAIARADPAEQRPLRGTAAALRSLLHSFCEEYSPAISYAVQALEDLPPDAHMRPLISIGLAFAYLQSGDLAAAQAVLDANLALAQARPDAPAPLAILLTMQALVYLSQARQRAAVAIIDQALALIARLPGPVPATLSVPTHHIAAILLIDQNRLAEADTHLQRASAFAEQSRSVQLRIPVLRAVARMALIRGDDAAAAEAIERAAAEVELGHAPLSRSLIDAYRARLALRAGDLGAAEALTARAVRQADAAGRLCVFDEIYLAQARLLLARGEPGLAAQELEQVRAEAAARGHARVELGALVVLALARAAAGELGAALAALEQPLARAAPEGLLRLFLDEGAPLQRLCAEALRRWPERHPGRAYLQQILAAFGQEPEPPSDHGQPAPRLSAQAPGPLREPLTARELEVLRLLAAGDDTQAIARKLVVSASTVKSHIHQILGKLGARNRLEATLRARAAGLV